MRSHEITKAYIHLYFRNGIGKSDQGPKWERVYGWTLTFSVCVHKITTLFFFPFTIKKQQREMAAQQQKQRARWLSVSFVFLLSAAMGKYTIARAHVLLSCAYSLLFLFWEKKKQQQNETRRVMIPCECKCIEWLADWRIALKIEFVLCVFLVIHKILCYLND